MRQLQRFIPKVRLSKPALIALIALLSTFFAALMMFERIMNKRFNDNFYDFAYDLRRAEDGRDSPVVVVLATEDALKNMNVGNQNWPWPWPRQFWSFAADYAAKNGAKVVAFDIIFPDKGSYDKELGDSETFGSTIDAMTIPVVFGVATYSDGAIEPVRVKLARPPRMGLVDFADSDIMRTYPAGKDNVLMLGSAAVVASGARLPEWGTEPFAIHYYGRHAYADNRTTFPIVNANDLVNAALDPDNPKKYRIDPSIFKDKIVFFGTLAKGASDIKAMPIDSIYPGVEIHATAAENLLKYQRVRISKTWQVFLITLFAAVISSATATLPRRTAVKLLSSVAVAVVLLLIVFILFYRENMIWIPPVAPLSAIGLSTLLAISWSYFVEDKQSRFYLKALGQYVSPHVAAELKADPAKLTISTEKRDLTILFSDIAGFTDLSEKLEERIGPLLNFYLDEMSKPVWAQDGTVDKYIGDAIMAFWNAPVLQSNHAICACHTALTMRRRLAEIQPELAELGADRLFSRIGINTGMCAFGNMGSQSKFNYSVIGDACNFASRLEAANKFYGTGILIGEATAQQVRHHFVIRKVDVLRVKGKQKPLAVYELIAEGTADPATAALISRYEAAHGFYLAKDWDQAEKILLDVLSDFPQDGPSKELLSRIAVFRREPPPVPWDGVYVAKEK